MFNFRQLASSLEPYNLTHQEIANLVFQSMHALFPSQQFQVWVWNRLEDRLTMQGLKTDNFASWQDRTFQFPTIKHESRQIMVSYLGPRHSKPTCSLSEEQKKQLQSLIQQASYSKYEKFMVTKVHMDAQHVLEEIYKLKSFYCIRVIVVSQP